MSSKKTVANIGPWKLSKVSEPGQQAYYLLKGKALGSTVEDYPKLESNGVESWVSFRYPVNIPVDVRNKVYEALMNLYKKGQYL